jgi:hypothetical protein
MPKSQQSWVRSQYHEGEKYLKYAGTTKIKELEVCRKLLIYITFRCKNLRIFKFVHCMQYVHCTVYNVHQYYIITASILVKIEVNVSLLLWYCSGTCIGAWPRGNILEQTHAFLPSSSLAPTPLLFLSHTTPHLSLSHLVFILSV